MGKIIVDELENSAGKIVDVSGLPVQNDLIQGEYVPTYSNEDNCTCSTDPEEQEKWYYTKVGSVWRVFGRCRVDPTENGEISWQVSLPDQITELEHKAHLIGHGWLGGNETGLTTNLRYIIGSDLINPNIKCCFYTADFEDYDPWHGWFWIGVDIKTPEEA